MDLLVLGFPGLLEDPEDLVVQTALGALEVL